jgi:hypothetical protein
MSERRLIRYLQLAVLPELVKGIGGIDQFEPFTVMQAVEDVARQRAEAVEIQIGDEGDPALLISVPDANAAEAAANIDRPDIKVCDAVPEQAG